MRRLEADVVCFPKHACLIEGTKDTQQGVSFGDLSSHERAVGAFESALKLRPYGFHVFVCGQERSGKVHSTLQFLKKNMQKALCLDWVYVFNFQDPNSPRPFCLGKGEGAILKKELSQLCDHFFTLLPPVFSNSLYLSEVNRLRDLVQERFNEQIKRLSLRANEVGLTILQNETGIILEPLSAETEVDFSKSRPINNELDLILVAFQGDLLKLQQRERRFRIYLAHRALKGAFLRLKKKTPALCHWFSDLRSDLWENLDVFLDTATLEEKRGFFEDRYGVNLFVTREGEEGLMKQGIFFENNITYESLFGAIRYDASSPNITTGTLYLMNAGLIHRANGGILIIKMDDLIQNPLLFETLKRCLKERRARFNLASKETCGLLSNAPTPIDIPLDIQIFLIGSPEIYEYLSHNDTDFHALFKIRADILHDMPASDQNIQVFQSILSKQTQSLVGSTLTPRAISYLSSYATRCCFHRNRLSSQIEIFDDIIIESFAHKRGEGPIDVIDIQETFDRQYFRTNAFETLFFEQIEERHIHLTTHGVCVGEINALSVIEGHDFHFGIPSRLSASTHVADEGVMDIEFLCGMSGAAHQKSTLIIEGLLKKIFQQTLPLSFGCTLTFEQNYSDIDGDSASLAEILVILSSLSKLPLRQDLAITGSVDQVGRCQAVGGVSLKIEGFHRVCTMQGLTKTQGVVIPFSNEDNVVLKETIVSDIQKGDFHIYSISSLKEAVELFFDKPYGYLGFEESVGEPSKTRRRTKKSPFIQGSVLEAAFLTLKAYHTILNQDKK